jgi:metal-dependent amidase/aminoacylase/carboxypeptidase family protein
MPEFCRIHGIVTNGGAMPNIIPAEASCRFYLRSADEKWMDILDRRFSEMVRGAALIAGTTYTQKKFSIDCRSRKPNRPLNESFLEVMTDLGETLPVDPEPGRESSDFGDFSRAIPGAHPYFGISDHRIGAHSPEFMDAAQSPRGLTAMLKAASGLAYTACRFLDDPEFRQAVRQDFLN